MAITSLAERQDLASQMKDKHGGDVVSYVGCSSWGIAGQSCAPFATSAVRLQSGASSQWNMTPPPGAYDPQLPSGKNSVFPVRRQAPFGTTVSADADAEN